MGKCVSTLKGRREPNKAITLAIVGLDNAGKTTLCSVLTGEQPDLNVAPTVGFRNVKFSHSNFDVTVFDVGGGKNIRPIWKTYFGEVFGLLFVIDSSSPSQLSEVRDVFEDTLAHPQVSGKPVLILANKVDKAEHMKETDIVNGLHFENAANANNCPAKLVMVSALMGVGSKMDKEISRGLQWLLDKIRSSLASLEPRIEEEMKTTKLTRDKEREDRKNRVKKQREEREKAEELEITQLGLSTKEESETDDIIVGDPFKVLDLEELKKKEQQLKKAKLLKQARMKELGLSKDREQNNTDASYTSATRDGLEAKQPNTKIKMKLSDLSDGSYQGQKDTENIVSAASLSGRHTKASTLPPLESQVSHHDMSLNINQKRHRKKKRLTDYHLKSLNTSDPTPSPGGDSAGGQGLFLDYSDLQVKETPSRDITPHFSTSGKTRFVKVGMSDEDEYGINSSRSSEMKQSVTYDDVSDFNCSQKYGEATNIYSSKEDEYSTNLTGHNKFPTEKDTRTYVYQRSINTIPSLRSNRSDATSELSDSKNQNYSGTAETANQDQSLKNELTPTNSSRSTNSRKKKKNPLVRQPEEEDNDSFASHTTLKETLRFPLNRTDIENLSNFSSKQTLRTVENADFAGSQHRNNRNDDDDGRSDHSSFTVRSGKEDPELTGADNRGKIPDRPHKRKKKKHFMLRSNKLAPSDDDSLSRETYISPRAVQEHKSQNVADFETPAKDSDSENIQYLRSLSRDSDFNLKWGLAEDLSATDGSSHVGQHHHQPNF